MDSHTSFTSLFIGALLGTSALAADVCGVSSPCEISGKDGGTYYVSLPNDARQSKDLKPFVFFHGHNGSGRAVLKNKNLVQKIHDAGYVLIAPDGPEFSFNGRISRGWAARPEEPGESRGGRSDIAFVEAVLRDVASKHAVDISKTVISGFSSGGSMAWYFSCYSSLPLKGVLSVAGGLRRPLPTKEKCKGGARTLFHLHGFSDRQVPLEGRRIRAWHQGDVFEGLSIQRTTNQCRSKPDAIETKGPFWCRTWSGCATGQPSRFCLHPNGHSMPQNWLAEGLNFIENVEN